MVAGRLRVWDAPGQRDYSGYPYRKSQFRNSYHLDECEIRKNLSHFLLANRKSSLQLTRIHSLGKTERIQITAVLTFLHEFLLLHTVFFRNIA